MSAICSHSTRFTGGAETCRQSLADHGLVVWTQLLGREVTAASVLGWLRVVVRPAYRVALAAAPGTHH